MKRTSDTLVRQAQNFLFNLGNAQGLDMIIAIDPVFAQFMKDECGLDLELLKKVSIAAAEAASTLKSENGIVTPENCEKFLKNNGVLETVV